MTQEVLRKIRFISRILIGLAVIAAIPLTVEIMGDMRPEWITVWAWVLGIGFFGGNFCTILWGIATLKQQRKAKK